MHTGTFYDKPASGNHVRSEGTAIDVIENGEIVEQNLTADVTQFTQQFVRQ